MNNASFNVKPNFLIIGIIISLAAAIGVVATLGQIIFKDTPSDSLTSSEIIPIGIQLNKISILQVNDRSATIGIEFAVHNPNPKSVILPFVSYQLYADDLRIHSGEIGERLNSMVAGSNYFTLLSNKQIIIKDEFTLKNTGNTAEFWNSLLSNSTKWRVSGTATYALSSMTAGGQNEISFEFP